MKEIVILSGKGGTGKTTVVASFAALANNKVMTDCDVDAPDLHLMLRPTPIKSGQFLGLSKAEIDPEKCIGCGLCAEVCRYDAVSRQRITVPSHVPWQADANIKDVYIINPLSCEGCGFCVRACPFEAAHLVDTVSGQWFIADTSYGPLVHARLGVAEENSGKLVAEVKKIAREEAERIGAATIIVDGPPGIGCPVMSSLSGVAAALLVTEPTLSGQHDLERTLNLAMGFRVPAFVCINKFDVNEENARAIEAHCESIGVPVLARLPFDEDVSRAIAKGTPIVEFSRGKVATEIEKLWTALEQHMAKVN